MENYGADSHRIVARLTEHPRFQSLARNMYRWTLAREFKHMAVTGPGFALRKRRDGGYDIIWKKNIAGKTRPLSEIRGTFSGDCYVMGTGPSIQNMNLQSLKGQYLIGVNGAISKFNELGLKPDSYVITDWDFFENRFDMVRDVMLSGAKCFFSYAGLSRICRREPGLLLNAEIYLTEVINRRYGIPRMPLEAFHKWAYSDPDLLLPHEVRSDDSRVGFSRNMEKGVFCSRTILFRALQVAYYLGFRRFYILGMDLNYRGDNPRFYESKDAMRPSKIDKDYEPYILPAFKVLAELCEAGEVSAYNLSPASRLPADVIPRTTLEAAINGEP